MPRHRDQQTDKGLPIESQGIEGIYIMLSAKDALRLNVETGDMVEIKRMDSSIHAKVEVEAERNGEALPLILSFDKATEKKYSGPLHQDNNASSLRG